MPTINRQLLETGDQPAFFKELCLKYQFPSGMNKIGQTVAPMLSQNIGVRQFSFFIKCLSILSLDNIHLSKDEAGYYVFNSLDVLTLNASPEEVCSQIKTDKNFGISREVKTPGKQSSYDKQHINEQINLLVLANVIYLKNNEIYLNIKEQPFIDEIAESALEPPGFDFSAYDLNTLVGRQAADADWQAYFATGTSISDELLSTRLEALGGDDAKSLVSVSDGRSKKELGDAGEEYVYTFEKQRVLNSAFPRFASKVKNRSAERGIGYDIQSVHATSDKPDTLKSHRS